MFMLYLDASGTVDQSDATRHYVLVGAAVHEHTWFALNKRIRGPKAKYAYPGEDFELHVKDFCISISAQGKVPGFDAMNVKDRRDNVLAIWDQKLKAAKTSDEREALKKAQKRMRPFIHLTRAQRSQLYEDALDLVGGHTGLVLFAEAIEKKHPGVINGTVDCTRQAFEQVITRFDAYLRRKAIYKQLYLKRFAHSDKGLIVMDRDLETERDIEGQFADYQKQGHPWGQLEFVMDAPFFVDSMKFPGIQLGDVCAYAVRRYLDRGAVPGGHEEKQFNRIFQRFDRDAGKLHGLRHYTQSGTCQCMICKERGHN
jgi:hypothetical protein